MVDEGQPLKRGDRLAEWDPNSLPILTEVDGLVRYEDIVEGLCLREMADETTGVSQKVIIDWRGGSKASADLRPAIVIVDKKGKVISLPNGEARYLALGRRHSLGRRWRRGEGGRRPRAHSDGRRQDARHHRRSAARGRAVRSPQAEGLRGARRNRRLYRVRQGLQEQAARDPEAEKREAGPGRVSVAEGQARQRARRRFRGEGRLHHRRSSLTARHPAHQGRRGTGGLPDPAKSRRSIGCRA